MLWESEASGFFGLTLWGLDGSSGLDLPGLMDPGLGEVGDVEVGATCKVCKPLTRTRALNPKPQTLSP